MGLFPFRRLTASFIGVFIVGAIVGALIISSFTDKKLSRFMSNTSDPVSMADRINQKYLVTYQLTPEEQARIAPLTKEMAQRLYQLRRQFGTDIIATLDEYHEKIAEQMIPAHRDLYTKDNKDRKSRMVTLLQTEPAKTDPGQK